MLNKKLGLQSDNRFLQVYIKFILFGDFRFIYADNMLEKEEIPVDKKWVPIEDNIDTQDNFLRLQSEVEDLNDRIYKQPWDLCLLDTNLQTRQMS